jgi:hypothetical protein
LNQDDVSECSPRVLAALNDITFELKGKTRERRNERVSG